MEELRRLYRAALPGRIQALEAAGERPFDGDSLETIRRIAHSLRGSGATYGFPVITTRATLVEEAADEDLKPRLANLLDALRTVAAGERAAPVRVLLVDDDPETRLVARFGLEHGGFEVDEVADATAALAVVGVPDVILMDLMLGPDDGQEVAAALRDRSPWRDVPVVFLTARHDADTAGRLRAGGALGVLAKPFDPLALANDLRALLDD